MSSRLASLRSRFLSFFAFGAGFCSSFLKRVPIVIRMCAAPMAMKNAVGAVSSEKPAMNGIAISRIAST